ncbi:OB-fold domain-containing protein [Candidatus Woesearchaeota archaeon]|nr:OB-fold domain-containing protein [Candidatus Woesearchaeota archaeon]
MNMHQNVAKNLRRIKEIPVLVGSKGKIIEYTKVTSAPAKFDMQKPYFVALIELENGERISAQLVDCEDISEGMEVEGVVRKLFSHGDKGLIQYGVKFRPNI